MPTTPAMPDTHEAPRPERPEPELQVVVVDPANQRTRRQVEADAYEAYRRAAHIVGRG